VIPSALFYPDRTAPPPPPPPRTVCQPSRRTLLDRRFTVLLLSQPTQSTSPLLLFCGQNSLSKGKFSASSCCNFPFPQNQGLRLVAPPVGAQKVRFFSETPLRAGARACFLTLHRTHYSLSPSPLLASEGSKCPLPFSAPLVTKYDSTTRRSSPAFPLTGAAHLSPRYLTGVQPRRSTCPFVSRILPADAPRRSKEIATSR